MRSLLPVLLCLFVGCSDAIITPSDAIAFDENGLAQSGQSAADSYYYQAEALERLSREVRRKAAAGHFKEVIAAAIQATIAEYRRSNNRRDRYSANRFGAVLEVPMGSYDGNGIAALQGTYHLDENGSVLYGVEAPVNGVPGRGVANRGWNFEPVQLLSRRWDVVEAYTNEYEVQPPTPQRTTEFFTQCKVEFQYQLSSMRLRKAGGPANRGFCSFTYKYVSSFGDPGVIRGPSACALNAMSFCNPEQHAFGADFLSDTGQIVLHARAENDLVVVEPDGTETAFTIGNVPQDASVSRRVYFEAINPAITSMGLGGLGAAHHVYYPTQQRDRNGQLTTYAYDANGFLESMTDHRGRVTRYTRDANGFRIVAITTQGAGGREQTYKLDWKNGLWDLGQHPNCCLKGTPGCNQEFTSYDQCPRIGEHYTTLDRLTLPDGRFYQFGYTDMGALSEVTLPDGAVRRYAYTCVPSDRKSCGPQVFTIPTATGPLGAGPDFERLLSETVFPEGLSGPSYVTRYEQYWLADGFWEHTVFPDGTVLRTRRQHEDEVGTCAAPLSGVLIEERWSGGQGSQPAAGPGSWSGEKLLERVAYDYDRHHQAGADCLDIRAYDERVRRAQRTRDGVSWTQEYAYDPHPLFAARTSGNVTREVVTAPDGQLLVTGRGFTHNPALLARNLLRLPDWVTTEGRSYGEDGTPGQRVLNRVEYAYDGEPVLRSGVSRLAPVDDRARGNETAMTRYADAAGRTGGVTVRTQYFDDGLPAFTWDPNGSQARDGLRAANGGAPASGEPELAAATTFDGLECVPGVPLTKTTVLPLPGNGAVHRVVESTDCYTGAALARFDVSGAASCNQYDPDGRLIEVAGPGDALSALPDGIRDPRCPATSSTELGSGGSGPTAWLEYLDLSDATRRRTVTHTKNGTSQGHVATAWFDGLNRKVQECNTMDAASVRAPQNVPSGFVQSCSWAAYDFAGRPAVKTLAVFASRLLPERLPIPDFADRTTTTYDGLGRKTSIVAGGRLTLAGYDSENNLLRTTTTSPAGRVSRTLANVFGHRVRQERSSTACAGGFCAATFDVDGLGRLVRSIEPKGVEGEGGAVTFTEFDDLARPRRVVDPDRGTTTHTFDANGNRLTETDAEGETVVMRYDALNRMVEKTYPPSSPEAERALSLHYDGFDPTVPAGVEVSGTTALGKLTSNGNGLVRIWRAYDVAGRVTATFTRIDDGRIFASRASFGYPSGQVPGAGSVELSTDVPFACDAAGGKCTPAERLQRTFDGSGYLAKLELVDVGTGSVTPLVAGTVRGSGSEVIETRFGNGTRTQRGYEEHGQRALRHLVTFDGAGVPIQAHEYLRDGDDNIIGVNDFFRPEDGRACDPIAGSCSGQEGPMSARYEYDDLDRVVAMKSGALERTWKYDAVGNLRQVAQKGVGPFERELTYGGRGADGAARPPHAVATVTEGGTTETLEYDRSGRLVATDRRLGGDVRLTWNADDMPIAAIDGKGERLNEKHFLTETLWKKEHVKDSGVAEVVYYLGALRLERRGAAEVSRYFYDDVAERDPDANGALFFHHADLGGTASVITDGAGKAVYRETFFPFGETRERTGTFTPLRRYANKEHEQKTGFIDYGARLYDPQLGRWISPDDEPGEERYTYVGNNPVTRVDPDGHKSCLITGGKIVACIETDSGWIGYNGKSYTNYNGRTWEHEAQRGAPTLTNKFEVRSGKALEQFGKKQPDLIVQIARAMPAFPDDRMKSDIMSVAVGVGKTAQVKLTIDMAANTDKPHRQGFGRIAVGVDVLNFGRLSRDKVLRKFSPVSFDTGGTASHQLEVGTVRVSVQKYTLLTVNDNGVQVGQRAQEIGPGTVDTVGFTGVSAQVNVGDFWRGVVKGVETHERLDQQRPWPGMFERH